MPETNNEVTTTEIFEFLKDHMVMKEDFEGMRSDFKRLEHKVDNLDSRLTALEHKVDSIENRLTALERKVDGLENRLAAIQQELEDIRKHLEALRKNTYEDSNAFAGDILELRHRVENLEKRVQQFQTA